MKGPSRHWSLFDYLAWTGGLINLIVVVAVLVSWLNHT